MQPELINWPTVYVLFGTLALLTIIVAVRRAREDMRELERLERSFRERMEQFVGVDVPTRAIEPEEPTRPLQSVHGECHTETMVTIWPVGGERKRETFFDLRDHWEN